MLNDSSLLPAVPQLVNVNEDGAIDLSLAGIDDERRQDHQSESGKVWVFFHSVILWLIASMQMITFYAFDVNKKPCNCMASLYSRIDLRLPAEQEIDGGL